MGTCLGRWGGCWQVCPGLSLGRQGCAWGSGRTELDSCSVTWAWSRGMQTGGLCIFLEYPQCLHSVHPDGPCQSLMSLVRMEGPLCSPVLGVKQDPHTA